jgi:hypothetical protein
MKERDESVLLAYLLYNILNPPDGQAYMADYSRKFA